MAIANATVTVANCFMAGGDVFMGLKQEGGETRFKSGDIATQENAF